MHFYQDPCCNFVHLPRVGSSWILQLWVLYREPLSRARSSSMPNCTTLYRELSLMHFYQDPSCNFVHLPRVGSSWILQWWVLYREPLSRARSSYKPNCTTLYRELSLMHFYQEQCCNFVHLPRVGSSWILQWCVLYREPLSRARSSYEPNCTTLYRELSMMHFFQNPSCNFVHLPRVGSSWILQWWVLYREPLSRARSSFKPSCTTFYRELSLMHFYQDPSCNFVHLPRVGSSWLLQWWVLYREPLSRAGSSYIPNCTTLYRELSLMHFYQDPSCSFGLLPRVGRS